MSHIEFGRIFIFDGWENFYDLPVSNADKNFFLIAGPAWLTGGAGMEVAVKFKDFRTWNLPTCSKLRIRKANGRVNFVTGIGDETAVSS